MQFLVLKCGRLVTGNRRINRYSEGHGAPMVVDVEELREVVPELAEF